jgi:ankyrin repeat protein
VDLARLLMEHGADATVMDKHGHTPLHVASQAGKQDVARFFVEHSVPNKHGLLRRIGHRFKEMWQSIID